MRADPQRVKIIRIFSRLCVGGPSIHVISLNDLLDRKRFESILVTGTTEPEEGDMIYLAEGRNLDIRIIPEMGVRIKPCNDIISTWKLWKIIRREKPQIIHTHTAKAGFLGRLLGKMAGVPILVHTMHGHAFRGYRNFYGSGFYKWIERNLTKISDSIVTVSEDVKREIVENRVAPPEKIRVIELGFDFSPLDDLSPHRGALRKELGIDETAILLGAVSRLVPIKNLDMFIRAGKIMLEQGKNIKLIIAGDGETKSALEQTTREGEMESSVFFLGFRKDLPKIYADLDILVNCSHNEGTAVSAIEAMAAGVPVVATQVGGMADLLGYGKYGMLAEPENTEDLARKITDLLDHPEKAGAFGARAKEMVRNRYALPRLIRDIDNLYIELLDKKSIGRNG